MNAEAEAAGAPSRALFPSLSRSRSVLVLGSTGSIGTQALDVIRRNPSQFSVVGIAARGSDIGVLAEQALEFGVQAVAVARPSAVEDFRLALAAHAQREGYTSRQFRLPRIFAGPDAVGELIASTPAEVVLNGMPGSQGLSATLAALRTGATLALANKESLVVGGPLVLREAAPGQIVPVDSEHSALAQCLRGGRAQEVTKLVLTASGGPFRGRRREELGEVTVEHALAHPTWSMGPVVTINSATLVNKGLEVIEAHLLFGIPLQAIAVTVHPQSVIHSMVEFTDGSTLAQVSPPDMRLPIALGLAWPERIPQAVPAVDWTRAHTWDLFPLDEQAFPAVALAREAGRRGGTFPAVYNAANEECVDAFRIGRLSFLGIVDTVARVIDSHQEAASSASQTLTLEDVLAADQWARRTARELVRMRLRHG
jgi:1-deoxy-D-xylulose-5-phosphate reductoisomerase